MLGKLIDWMTEHRVFRILLFVVVPVLFAWILFPTQAIPLDWSQNETRASISPEHVQDPGGIAAARTLFRTPFNLDYYRLVIEDTSTHEEGCYPRWNFTVGGETKVVNTGGTAVFSPIKIEERYNWSKLGILQFDQEIASAEEGCGFSFGFEATANPYPADVMALRGLFFLSWVAIFVLIFQVVSIFKRDKPL